MRIEDAISDRQSGPVCGECKYHVAGCMPTNLLFLRPLTNNDSPAKQLVMLTTLTTWPLVAKPFAHWRIAKHLAICCLGICLGLYGLCGLCVLLLRGYVLWLPSHEACDGRRARWYLGSR